MRQTAGATLPKPKTKQCGITPFLADHHKRYNVTPKSLSDLLSLDREQFDRCDIARTNLLCAEGLPGAEDIDLPRYLDLLDEMAVACDERINRSWRLFKRKPAEFDHSENVFRVLTMQHVLRTQFNVQYDEKVSAIVASGKEWNSDDSSEVFIHGILSDKRTGTCSSLPVFSIAVGRRLGYPLKLVRVPNHTLFRWDESDIGGEKFNIEHTPAGSTVRPDDYYYTWPCLWTEQMRALNERTKVWLHSMNAEQEISKFLCNRALILRDVGRSDEAMMSVEVAYGIDPINPACFDIMQDVSMRTAMAPPRVVEIPVPVKLKNVSRRVSAPRPKLPFPESSTDPHCQLANEQYKLTAAGYPAGSSEHNAAITRISELVDQINRHNQSLTAGPQTPHPHRPSPIQPFRHQPNTGSNGHDSSV